MRTIMIRDEVYKRLSKIKGKKSFSKLLDSMLGEQNEVRMNAFRKLKGILTDEQAEEAYRRIKEIEKHAKVAIK
jgi:predicted CopG family antitoxin